MGRATATLRDMFDGGRPWLEEPHVARVLAPALAGRAPKSDAPVVQEKPAGFLARNFLDVGIISSASLFMAAWSLGIVPLTIAAGIGLAAVGSLRAYQEFAMPHDADWQTPQNLNRKGALTRFFNRPAASYTLASLTGLGYSLLATGMALTGRISALAGQPKLGFRFAAMALFGLVFSASNNMKAARLDAERGYEVEALPGLRRLGKSWSEKLSVVGNIARNFVAGPLVGLLSLPLMREALKFSRLDKEHQIAKGVSYTDEHLGPVYHWKAPHSDSGMSRRMSGLASIFAAAGALLSGDPKAAGSMIYPAVAQFVLGRQSDRSYAALHAVTAFGEVASSEKPAKTNDYLNEPRP